MLSRWFYKLSFIVFVLACQNVYAEDHHPILKLRLNLNECIDMALRNNEEIKKTRYDIYGTLARKIEATKRYVPVVSYKYRFAPVPRDLDNAGQSFFSGDISVFNSIKLEVGIPVSTFGRLQVAKELADIGVDASKLQTVRKADEIVLDIYKLYNGILLARELRVLANKGLEAVDSKIQELEKEETADQLQILKLKAVIFQIEKKLDEADKKETVALAMLKVRMGIEDDVDFDVKSKALGREYFKDRSYDSLLAQSHEERPEFRLLTRQVQAKTLQYRLEKKEYLPMLKMGSFFDYGVSPGIRGDEGNNAFINPFNYVRAGLGLELSGELDFRKIKSKVEFAKVEQLKAIADKRSNTRLLELDLKNAYLDWQQKKRLLDRVEKEQRSARQIVFLTKSNLEIGLGEKKDYLEALQSYLLIQAAVHETVFNYNVAVATIKQKIGQLYSTKTLDLSEKIMR